jgi:imidazolonepropionase-like amidohydrolase
VKDLLIENVTVLDCTGRDPTGPLHVVVDQGRIDAIVPASERPSARHILDGSGCTLMPGLTDAHVHFGLIGNHGDHGDEPWIDHVLKVSQIIERALDQGFTTVRDAGGLEPAWAGAVANGLLRGPRILPSGSWISQTGGHGDARAQHDAVHSGPTIPGLVARSEVVDGPDAVRRAVREQLRRGATQIKIHASGGIRSPADPYDSVQFTREEIAAAVDAAAAWGTYVLAHCLTSPSIENALDGGVRSIEHGTFLEPSTAARMASDGAFMVPTLQALNRLADNPGLLDLPTDKRDNVDLRAIVRAATASVRTAANAGVSLGSGSDIVGPDQGFGGREIGFIADVVGAHEAIIGATRTNARLFNLEDRIGTVEVGKDADLILVAGEPIANVRLLATPDAIPVVIKRGVVMKDRTGRLSGETPARENDIDTERISATVSRVR